MNERETPGFIVEDLDDFHLLIKPEHEHRIRRELETEVRFTRSSLLSCKLSHFRSSKRTHIAWKQLRNETTLVLFLHTRGLPLKVRLDYGTPPLKTRYYISPIA